MIDDPPRWLPQAILLVVIVVGLLLFARSVGVV